MRRAWEFVRFACWAPGAVGRLLWSAALSTEGPPRATLVWMLPFMLLLAPFALLNTAVDDVRGRRKERSVHHRDV